MAELQYRGRGTQRMLGTQRETLGTPSGGKSPSTATPTWQKFSGRKKTRRLNSLDASSGDDADSDEHFKGYVVDDDEDGDFEEEDAGSDSSETYGGQRRGPMRRSTRALTLCRRRNHNHPTARWTLDKFLKLAAFARKKFAFYYFIIIYYKQCVVLNKVQYLEWCKIMLVCFMKIFSLFLVSILFVLLFIYFFC